MLTWPEAAKFGAVAMPTVVMAPPTTTLVPWSVSEPPLRDAPVPPCRLMPRATTSGPSDMIAQAAPVGAAVVLVAVAARHPARREHGRRADVDLLRADHRVARELDAGVVVHVDDVEDVLARQRHLGTGIEDEVRCRGRRCGEGQQAQRAQEGVQEVPTGRALTRAGAVRRLLLHWISYPPRDDGSGAVIGAGAAVSITLSADSRDLRRRSGAMIGPDLPESTGTPVRISPMVNGVFRT